MRSLKGDVDVLGLGTLLQALAMTGREGVLTLLRGSNRKTIHFSPRGMRLHSTSMKRIDKLGDILLKKKKISAEDLKSLLGEQKLLGWKLGHLAVDSGKVSRKDVEEALREQVQEEVYDMFLWVDASFEFVQGPPRSKPDHPLSELTYSPSITSLVLEAAHHADEILKLRKLLDDPEVVLARIPKPLQPVELGDDLDSVAAILPLINGRRTLHDIEHDSTYPRYSTLRAIRALLAHGYAQRVKAAPVRHAAPPAPRARQST